MLIGHLVVQKVLGQEGMFPLQLKAKGASKRELEIYPARLSREDGWLYFEKIMVGAV